MGFLWCGGSDVDLVFLCVFTDCMGFLGVVMFISVHSKMRTVNLSIHHYR